MASTTVFTLEKVYSEDEAIGPCPYSDEKIQGIKDERYEELADEFVDKIFDVESKLSRE